MMYPGEVVRIRVNPRDCMAVADIVKALGFQVEGMSFSQACALAFSSLLETMRVMKKVPRRDGFEYTQVMAPFANRARSSRKLAITTAFALAGDESQVRALPTAPPPLTYEQKKARDLSVEIGIRVMNSDYPDPKDFEKVTWLNAVVEGTMTWDEYTQKTGEVQ